MANVYSDILSSIIDTIISDIVGETQASVSVYANWAVYDGQSDGTSMLPTSVSTNGNLAAVMTGPTQVLLTTTNTSNVVMAVFTVSAQAITQTDGKLTVATNAANVTAANGGNSTLKALGTSAAIHVYRAGGTGGTVFAQLIQISAGTVSVKASTTVAVSALVSAAPRLVDIGSSAFGVIFSDTANTYATTFKVSAGAIIGGTTATQIEDKGTGTPYIGVAEISTQPGYFFFTGNTALKKLQLSYGAAPSVVAEISTIDAGVAPSLVQCHPIAINSSVVFIGGRVLKDTYNTYAVSGTSFTLLSNITGNVSTGNNGNMNRFVRMDSNQVIYTPQTSVSGTRDFIQVRVNEDYTVSVGLSVRVTSAYPTDVFNQTNNILLRIDTSNALFIGSRSSATGTPTMQILRTTG